MPLTTQPLPYGLRDVKLVPFADATNTAYGTGIDLPAARTMTFTDSEEFQELRGDDEVKASRGSGPQVSWELEEGGISLEAYKIIAGGAIVETGMTPNQIKTYTKLNTSTRPYFRAEGQAMSDSGGDFHVILFRCRATGDITGSMSDGTFWLTGCSGDAYPSQVTADVGKVYEFVQNETAVAIDTTPGS